MEHTRTLYRSDDLSGLLPLGALESQALPGETLSARAHPGAHRPIFGTRVNGTILTEGGYVQLPGGTDWWIPSGRIFYSPGDTDTPAQELTEARAHFYMVRRAIDPFGAITRVPTTATTAAGPDDGRAQQHDNRRQRLPGLEPYRDHRSERQRERRRRSIAWER